MAVNITADSLTSLVLGPTNSTQVVKRDRKPQPIELAQDRDTVHCGLPILSVSVTRVTTIR